ncbi:MAG: menaquinone-dependent protoporphyrinogen IX dehydrogenase [Rhodospirillaceae bacterium]
MSLPVSLYYASHDGHTRRIAARFAERLREAGCDAAATDLAERQPDAAEIAAAGVVAIVAAIRYGRHLPPARRMVAAHRDLLAGKPLAVISINLTARKPEKRTLERCVYLRKWMARAKLSPTLAAAVAGMLDYPRYSRFDRFMIRLIMTITKGPTDPSQTIEFTDWQQVDGLAAEIARLAGADGA